jgi:hypothetical protein
MSQLSESVLKETTVYLGPASKKFLERQTQAHLNSLQFDNLEKQHIDELAKWVGISAGLLIGKDKAEDLVKKIRQL